MKIIVYKDNFATGRGADRSVLNFVNAARDFGAEVVVLTNQDQKTPFSAPVDPTIRRVFVPYRPFRGVVDAVDGLGADLVVVAGSNEVIALTAEKVAKTPILLQLHLCPTGFLKRFHPFRNRAFLHALAFPVVVQVLCKSYERMIRPYVRGRIVTIGNFSEIEPPAVPLPEQNVILYPAAQLNKVKNQLLILRAFARIAADVPRWTLELCGMENTGYAGACRRFVHRHHLEEQVVFTGYRKDMAAEYAKCAFVAHTSTLEGFPLAFLEAAKFGKAVLALRATPGNDEIIVDGVTGRLVEGSVAAVAKGLLELIRKKETRRTLGAEAKRRDEKDFSEPVIIGKWAKTIQRCIHAAGEEEPDGSVRPSLPIAIYKDNLSTGRGADLAVRNLAGMLTEAGMDVTVITKQPEKVPFSCPFDPQVRIIHTATNRLVTDITCCRPAVVISTGTNELVDLEAGLHRESAAAFPWPVVQQFHVYPPTMFKWRHPLRNLAIKRALKKVAAIQVLMPSFIEPTRQAAGLGPEARIVALGNAGGGRKLPSTEGSKSQGRTEEQNPPREKLIVYPAALNPGKRQDLLIRAFAGIADDFPDWTVELYGNGKKAHWLFLTHLIRNNGLAGRVKLMGFSRDLAAAYARAAFVAFPSAMEGFPMTILDANEAGLPIVGCNQTPAVSELIENGRTGLLADATPKAYGTALARLMEDEKLRQTLGRNAQRMVRHYSRANITKRWVEVLNGVLA